MLVYPATLFYVPPLSQRLCDRLVYLCFAVPENTESIQFLELILNLGLPADQQTGCNSHPCCDFSSEVFDYCVEEVLLLLAEMYVVKMVGILFAEMFECLLVDFVVAFFVSLQHYFLKSPLKLFTYLEDGGFNESELGIFERVTP